jgi:hypothetical protein
MDPLEELKALRRLAELEDKASGQIALPEPTAQKSSSILGPIRGAIEAGAGLITGMATAPIVEGAKIYGTLSSGKYGTPEGIRAGEEFGQRFQQNFYQPRTEEGQRYLRAIGEAAASSGMQGVPLPILADLGRGVSTATRAAPLTQQVSTVAQMPFQKQLQARAEAASLRDYARGPQIDAAANAQRLKIAIDPTNIEPSASSRFYSGMAGPRGPEALSAANKNQVRNVALNEMGLPPTTQLNGPTAFDTARANLAGPYDEVKKLSTLTPDQTTIANLNNIRINEKIIGGKGVLKKVNTLVDDAVAKTQSGLTGAELLENVRTLRADAKKIYNNPSATPKQTSIADANLSIATELEKMIDSNISNPKLLEQWRGSRQGMARTYAYEAATDFNTGMVDVGKLARITAKDNALTGDIAALGKVAGNFPEAFTTQATSKFYQLPRATRSGLAGGAGALIGASVAPLLDVTGITGSIFGGVAGGLLGEFGGKMAANRMANPNYQAKLKLSDMRIPINQMATLMQPIPQNRAVVPYQAPVEVLQPGEGTYFPDFVMRPGGAGPLTTPGVAPGPAQIGMSQGPVGGQMGALRMEDIRARDLSMRQGAQAELQQAANEAASRQPTGGGSVLDFDPITGTYKVGGAGVKGATPEVFMANTGQSLMAASEKVASGKLFDLTAAEKVAFDKTKVDLAAAAPEFKGLSDKTVAAKMMDRQWVQDAITKAQQKAKGFQSIVDKATDAQMQRNAAIKRDQMLDLLTDLEETLRQGRPVSGTLQGPKTRAFKASQMVPPEITNAMDILSGLPRR